MEVDENNLFYYLNEGKEYKGKIDFNLDILDDQQINILSYSDIIITFEKFLEKKQKEQNLEEDDEDFFDIHSNNINYQYINYFQEGGWIELEENGFIIIDSEQNLDNLKIMIKALIINKDKIKINKAYNKIDEDINRIKEDLIDIKKGDKSYSKNFFNTIILTANPLMNDNKELRTMNDFNIIPATLYDLFRKEDYLKYTKFGVLTQQSFEEILSDKSNGPLILHLICKSFYNIHDNDYDNDNDIIINDNNDNDNNNILINNNDNNVLSDQSKDYINLIFEHDNTNNTNKCEPLDKRFSCDFIDKKKLDKIFENSKIKENIKNIILIISTQLAQDVYSMFEGYGFKHILVQHTTLADVDYVANFNLRFYENLILNRIQNLNDIYNDALNITINKEITTFCCCFHKHKTNCNFFQNLKNELYNINRINKPVMDITELKEIIPHFCHLKFKCRTSTLCNNEDFCIHKFYCLKDFKYDKLNNHTEIEKKKIEIESQRKSVNPILFSICCCNDIIKKENIIHNINNIFFKSFSKEKFIGNNKNDDVKIYNQKNYIPKYDKMFVLVGNNKDVNDVYNLIQKLRNKQFINIYGDYIEKLKVFINSFIEYFKERNYFNEYSEKEKIMEIEHILLDDNNFNDFKDNFKNNIIYYIYTPCFDLVKELERIPNYKVILFSEKEIENIDEKKRIKINIEPVLLNGNKELIPNGFIKYQHKYSVRNIWRKECKFDDLLKD